MLKVISRQKSSKWTLRRELHSKLYPYQKLRAFPFVLPPEEIIQRMSPYVKISCNEFGWRDRFLPPSYVAAKRPVMIEAVYFPTWLIGGRTLLNLIFAKGTPLEVPMSASTFNLAVPIPGCAVPLLSSASIWSLRSMDGIIPLPFTESFLKGQVASIETSYLKGIRCIPFTISPFSILKLIETAAGRTLTLGPESAYVRTSKFFNFSAMPVLLPMYVAKFKDEYNQSLRAFIEAHTIEASVKIDRFQAAGMARSHNRPMPLVLNNNLKDHDVAFIDDGNEVIDFGNPFKRLNGTFLTDNENLSIGLFEAYLWHMLGSYENVKKLESLGSLASDEDSRIHAMTAKEMENRRQALQERRDKLQKFGKAYISTATQENVRQRTSKLEVWSKYKTASETRRTSRTTTQQGPTTPPSQESSN